MPLNVQSNQLVESPIEGSVFNTLHQLVGRQKTAGFVRVCGSRANLDALGGHLQRCAVRQGREVVWVAGTTAQPWCEVARQLGVPTADAAELLAPALLRAAEGRIIIVHDRRPTRFGRRVAESLAELLQDESQQAQVWLLDQADLLPDFAAWELGGRLSEDDSRIFLHSLVDAHAVGVGQGGLAQLSRWSTSVLETPLAAEVHPKALDDEARRLLARLTLIDRICPTEWVDDLGSAVARERLRSSGMLHVREGFVHVATPFQQADEQDRRVVVACLRDRGQDVWDKLRAAELLVQDGDDEAWCLAEEALRGAVGQHARQDAWQRFDAMLLEREPEHDTLLKLARLALEFGDIEWADRLAHHANRGDASARAKVLIAKVLLRRGDLEAAAAAADSALTCSQDEEVYASVLAMRAELCFVRGEAKEGAQLAKQAHQQAGDVVTRLDARNTLGKLLLQQARWHDAELHFAADAQVAACAGLSRAELRARVNRAIARLQAGSAAEAESLLREVLSDAEARNIDYAKALALTNLAVVNTRMHRYVAALGDWQAAIDALRRAGDHRHLSHSHLNLAQLRLQVGLVSEARQALMFARRACPAGASPTHRALLGYVAAGVHYQRGETQQAIAELRGAIAVATTSSSAERLAECQLLRARIALDDGDVETAAEAARSASQVTSAHDTLAEAALLLAHVRRSDGEAYIEDAEHALEQARNHGSRLLQTEARALLAAAKFDDGEFEEGQRQLDAAIRLREGALAALPESLRTHFAAKRELALLRECESRLSADAPQRRIMRVQPTSPTPQRRVMVGDSKPMKRLYSLIRKVAVTDATVLITGESGTGKELVANAMHEASHRAGAPLVKVNCAALVETLLLSELFGHEKGAFTGASQRRRGCFEQAANGTLFLDEIGDVSPKTQVALLRVLQEKTYQRVGGTTTRSADVRVICATHRDLRAMVAEGTFREDLYYRLCGVQLEVPSLAARSEDIAVLAESILRRIAAEQGLPRRTLSAGALNVLQAHRWPGNIRELENVLRALALFSEAAAITAQDIQNHTPAVMGGSQQSAPPASGVRLTESGDVVYEQVRSGLSLPDMKKRLELDCLRRALAETEGNISKAAGLLGMKRPRVSQLVHQHGLKVGGAR